MADPVFKALMILLLPIPVGMSIILLLQPSLYFRWFPNPFMTDTSWSRIQLRVLGLVFCLFMLMVLSAVLSGIVRTDFTEGFRQNMLAALGIGFVIACLGGLLFGTLFQFSAIRAFLRSYEIGEKLETTEWERRLTLTFSLILLSIVGTALFLAAEGYHL